MVLVQPSIYPVLSGCAVIRTNGRATERSTSPDHWLYKSQLSRILWAQEIEITALVRLQHMVDVEPWISAEMVAGRRPEGCQTPLDFRFRH